MATRSSGNWASEPGNFDVLHCEEIFPSAPGDKYEVPLIKRDSRLAYGAVGGGPPDSLVPYNLIRSEPRPTKPLPGHAATIKELRANKVRVREEEEALEYGRPGVHFFIDDYRFEAAWTHYKKTLNSLKRYPVVFSPDFSMYMDWPLAACLYNHYRNRWMGAYWQARGLAVVPTIVWGNADTYEFCFGGVERGSVLGISTNGIAGADKDTKDNFREGYELMIERLAPELVLCYGRLPEWAHDLSPVRTYPTRWQAIRTSRAG